MVCTDFCHRGKSGIQNFCPPLKLINQPNAATAEINLVMFKTSIPTPNSLLNFRNRWGWGYKRPLRPQAQAVTNPHLVTSHQSSPWTSAAMETPSPPGQPLHPPYNSMIPAGQCFPEGRCLFKVCKTKILASRAQTHPRGSSNHGGITFPLRNKDLWGHTQILQWLEGKYTRNSHREYDHRSLSQRGHQGATQNARQ